MSIDLSNSSTARTIGLTAGADTGGQLFPLGGLPHRSWSEFAASGFDKSVCGVIYRGDDPAECGVPMGGISTGCVDIDTDGILGYSSIFGSYAPAGRLRHPFLGITAGESAWVLATGNAHDLETVLIPNQIHYWGHYPVADLEYETTAPVGVGLRAWSPFIPGDTQTSNTPGAVFEVRLRNLSDQPQSGRVTFSFPGPTPAEAQVSPDSPRQEITRNNFRLLEPIASGAIAPIRTQVSGKLNGITVESGTGVGYTLGVIGEEQIRSGTAIGPLGGSWARDLLDPMLPNPATTRKFLDPYKNDLGTSLAVEYSLAPREAKIIRFVLAWYSPIWKGEGDHVFTQMYATRYSNSREVAEFLAENHESLLRRILSWQSEVYCSTELPGWLRDALVNNLYLITETSL